MYIRELADAHIRHLSAQVPLDIQRQAWSTVILQTIDHAWKEHLATTDHLRQGIHLRSYAQKNPAHEFTTECFELFYAMLGKIKEQVALRIMHLHFTTQAKAPTMGSYRISNKPL